jgi:hypothetical protein
MAVAESVEQQADSFVRSTHKLLIDGEWVEAASGQTFETLNPATEEVLAEVAHGQAEDIEPQPLSFLASSGSDRAGYPWGRAAARR